MMQRSNRRKFRRRRQRAGFVSFTCVALVVLSGLLFIDTGSEQRQSEKVAVKVQRLETPDVARAPEAVKEVKEQADAPSDAEKASSGDAQTAQKEGGSAEEGSGQGGTGDASSGEDKSDDNAGDSGGASIPDPGSTDLYLTVPKMGLTDNYVANSDDPLALDQGAIKLPSTGFPWQDNANTYIAGHVLGYAGTGSYMQFAALPSMTYGDVIYLTDAKGTQYTYSVSEVLTVAPQDNWVTDPIAGKDMVTLQTCVNPPYYDQRLVVRAERTDVQVA